ncbi:MAG: SRPBCC domain-containing protein [Micavibrio sp.]|nr:SRPBCC domain-containing protein [Micavibrio sp.]
MTDAKTATAELAAVMGNDAFIITRSFDAPQDLVWKAHTELPRLAKWWGPKGLKWLGGTLDLTAGGKFHYGMAMPNGQEMWGRFTYREVAPQSRIVFINGFSDKDGNLTRHPLAPVWPLEVLNVLTLSEEVGKTLLTLRGYPINASAAEMATFNAGKPSMQQGFGATYAQLDEYLATL